jgi:hypothetical protein
VKNLRWFLPLIFMPAQASANIWKIFSDDYDTSKFTIGPGLSIYAMMVTWAIASPKSIIYESVREAPFLWSFSFIAIAIFLCDSGNC